MTSLGPSVCVVLLAHLPLLAQQFHVDAAASPGGNGQSWATAWSSLHQALASAPAGATIWVAAGSYAGGFVVPDQVRLLGGFQPGASRADQARPFERLTVLDGQNNARVVRLGNGTVLDGFVVQNGNAPSPGGGGALVDGTSPMIRRCVFTANRNSGGRGAALSVIHAGDPQVVDCVFHHNANTGHTIDVDFGGRGTYDHLTVVDNPHNGLHMQDGAGCVIDNSIFARNSSRGICDFSYGAVNQPTLRNNLFWQNGLAMMHFRGTELNTIAAINALAYATANVSADPSFVSATDYRLLSGSGAIDLGRGPPDGRLDLGGMPRALDGDLDGTMVADLGAHEFGNGLLAASGSTMAGGSLTFQLTGTTGLLGAFAIMLPGAPTTLAPYGTLYGTAPVAVFLGPLPAALSLAIPVGFVADLVAQGFVFGATGGNLSNPLGLAIR